jgi:hypothetical protein
MGSVLTRQYSGGLAAATLPAAKPPGEGQRMARVGGKTMSGFFHRL